MVELTDFGFINQSLQFATHQVMQGLEMAGPETSGRRI